MDIEAQLAAVGVAIYFVTQALKGTLPEWTKTSIGQRLLGWFPLALGGVAGLGFYLLDPSWKTYGLMLSVSLGVGAGGGAEGAWELYRFGRNKVAAAKAGKPE